MTAIRPIMLGIGIAGLATMATGSALSNTAHDVDSTQHDVGKWMALLGGMATIAGMGAMPAKLNAGRSIAFIGGYAGALIGTELLTNKLTEGAKQHVGVVKVDDAIKQTETSTNYQAKTIGGTAPSHDDIAKYYTGMDVDGDGQAQAGDGWLTRADIARQT